MVAGGAAAGLAGYFGTKAILDVTGASDAIADFGGQMYGGLHGNTRRVKRGMPAAPPAEIMSRADEPWSVNLPPMPAQASAASAPQATLLVKIDGPGHVASVSSSGYDDVQTMSMDTGRRTALP
jgi:hypothetical protein